MFERNLPTVALAGYMFIIFMVFSDAAFASDAAGGTGGAGLPWETTLEKIRRSISGPVAFTISLVGFVAAGATLVWGGEISEFAKRIIYLVLVVSMIVFANTLLTGVLFAGAVIPDAGLTL